MVRTFCLLSLTLLVAAAQEPVDSSPPLVVVPVEVDMADALGVEVELVVGFGRVVIEGGAAKLVEGRFEVTDSSLVPEPAYEVTDGQGVLSIVQPGADEDELGNADSEWNLAFGPGVRAVSIELGSGECEIEKAWPGLEVLHAEVGAGALIADLSRGWTKSVDDIIFEVGVGEIHIIVPDNIGVLVEAEGGLGEINIVGLSPDPDDEDVWLNDLWDTAEIRIEVSAEIGIGEITVEVAD